MYAADDRTQFQLGWKSPGAQLGLYRAGRTYKVLGIIFVLLHVTILLNDCGRGSGGGVGNSSGGISGNPSLTSLALSAGAIAPAFDPRITNYTATVTFLFSSVTITATPTETTSSVTVNGTTPTEPVNLAEGDNTLDVQVTTVGGATELYTITVTRQGAASFAQQAYAKASNTGAFDEFGTVVALSGDTLAVGAPFESSTATGINGDQTDNTAPKAGAVYVFTFDGSAWTQQAYIKASNTDKGDQFGTSVALSGDTLVVGAPFESSHATSIDGDQSDNSAPNAGAAYVFVRNGTTWTQQAYVKGSNTLAGVQFGTAVALSGDTLAIGEPFSGTVYVFVRSGTTWTQQTYINEGVNHFGWSVAVGGNALVIGEPLENSDATGIDGDETDHSAPDAGAVYVFVRNGATWTQQAYIKASNTNKEAQFGTSVALNGDTLVVGAPFEDSSATGIDGDETDHSAPNAGAVYVFTFDGDTWTQQAYVKASNTGAGDNFGSCVALSGDILAVGAYQSSSSSGHDGAAYVFTRSGATWTQQEYVKASNPHPLDWFGYSVALESGLLAIGANREGSSATGIGGDQTDTSSPLSGAVYLFQ